jgi:hypothetical protein
MTGNRSRPAAWRNGLLGGFLALACAAATVSADPGEPIVVRGEMARLLRQAYDYHYRNSNRNVFRSSNHYHPTKNIFRSSDHYQRRLAVSFDGYPLRTIVRYTSHHDGEARQRVYSFAHHRRHPYGPGWIEAGWWNPGVGLDDLARILIEEEETGEKRLDADASVTQAPPRPKPRSRWEIETVPVRIIERQPTQRAVMRTVNLPDGTTKTIIASEPVEQTIDDAWALLAGGDGKRAADLFAARSLDETDGPQAMIGFALARALTGDESAAARAIQLARAEDPDVLTRLNLDSALREIIAQIDRLCAEDSAAETDRGDAASIIRSTCRALLEGGESPSRIVER